MSDDDDSTLDSIADSIGTVTAEQSATDHDRLDESDVGHPDRDVQSEYDGGWSAGSPDRE